MSPEHRRALEYPYFIPDGSYLYQAPGYALIKNADDLPVLENRTAVLAVGSNQSPLQLARKFPFQKGGSQPHTIPVLKASLKDYDTVYSPHIARYGSVPATLHPSLGTTVSLFVNWLDDEQLESMHETELSAANYTFSRLEGATLEVEFLGPLKSVYYYHGRRGALALTGSPIALDSVDAHGRHWQAMNQKQIHKLVQHHFRPHQCHRDFLSDIINDKILRKQVTDFLCRFSMPHHEAADYLSNI